MTQRKNAKDGNHGSPAEVGGASIFVALIAFVWLAAFSLWFHSFGLPNNPPVKRWMIWAAIPWDLMDFADPPAIHGGIPLSWYYLPQRIPFFVTAIAIWLGAWGVGSFLIRLLRLEIRGPERLFFILCLGFSGTSLIMLFLGLCGQMSRWPLIWVLIGFCVLELFQCFRKRLDFPRVAGIQDASKTGWTRVSRLGWIVLIIAAPFVFGEILGAMSPQTDFDVVEYHLGGPKEWFQQGRITRLPHNVYTSFPFLSEMLILSGMVVYGDWQWGALAGQAVIAGFAPLTALGIFAAGRRWFSESAGWLGMLVYLTSPWTYRFTIIAYAEGGLSCYLFAAFFALFVLRDYVVEQKQLGSVWRLLVLTGALSGSAMACKYTGLVSVVIPIGATSVWIVYRDLSKNHLRSMCIVVVAFTIGLSASIGPWLLKNTFETGNPVYPLAFRIFGGIDRTEELDQKWRKGHAAVAYPSWRARLFDLPVKITDVMACNDWHSPLMFGLAPLSLIFLLSSRKSLSESRSQSLSQRAVIGAAWIYVVWQFSIWWVLTHHIDRFYVPMFSVVGLLAGVSGCLWESLQTGGRSNSIVMAGRNGTVAMIVASLLYNADLMLNSGISGFNAARLDLVRARDDIATSPRIGWINNEFESGRLPPNFKALSVGEALLFHARYPYLYNTVFDQSIFERICRNPNSSDHSLRPAKEIRAEFRRLGITHIDVNWGLVLMYRQPGNYGYTEFVSPGCFEDLRQLGVLGPPLDLPSRVALAMLDKQTSQLLNELGWGSRLVTTFAGEPAYTVGQIYPVLNSEEKVE